MLNRTLLKEQEKRVRDLEAKVNDIHVKDAQARADGQDLEQNLQAAQDLLDALKLEKNSISKSSPVGKCM